MKGNGKSVALAVLGVVLVGMTIAYAALQTNLSISGSVQSPSVSWDIEIENWNQSSSTGNPTITGPSITTTSITNLGVSLDKPGDGVTYTFDIVNKGTIDAKLNGTPVGGFTCTQGKVCTDITYDLTCDTAATTANTVLYAANDGDTDTAHCTLTISRSAGAVVGTGQTYTSNDGAGTFNMAWNYVQN